MDTKKELLQIIESFIIKHIQNLLKQAGQEVSEQEAKNLLGHIAKKMIMETNQ